MKLLNTNDTTKIMYQLRLSRRNHHRKTLQQELGTVVALKRSQYFFLGGGREDQELDSTMFTKFNSTMFTVATTAILFSCQ